jgi:hypothetical protein
MGLALCTIGTGLACLLCLIIRYGLEYHNSNIKKSQPYTLYEMIGSINLERLIVTLPPIAEASPSTIASSRLKNQP